MKYSLNKASYSWKRALLCGTCAEHYKKGRKGKLGHRVVHRMIAALELIPVVGQIISVAEKVFADRHVTKLDSGTKPHIKEAQTDASSNASKKSSSGVKPLTQQPKGVLDKAKPKKNTQQVHSSESTALPSREKRLLATALQSKHIKALWDQATAAVSGSDGEELQVEFVERTYSGFAAEYNPFERKIYLCFGLSDKEALTLFVFELTNAISSEKHHSLQKKARSGEIGREKFAKEAERIEHEGLCLHHRVIKQVIKEMNWSHKLNIYRDEPKDFKTYWNTVCQNSDHTHYWRLAWDSIQAKRKKRLKLSEGESIAPASREDHLLAAALESKHLRNLYKRANSTSLRSHKPKWLIQFVQQTPSKLASQCDDDKRIIFISSSLSDKEALTALVFELTNAIAIEKYAALDRRAFRGKLSREDYAQENAKVEHANAYLHYQVMTHVIKEMGWSPKLNIHRNTPKDFETYWSTVKDSDRTNYWRQRWEDIRDEAKTARF